MLAEVVLSKHQQMLLLLLLLLVLIPSDRLLRLLLPVVALGAGWHSGSRQRLDSSCWMSR